MPALELLILSLASLACIGVLEIGNQISRRKLAKAPILVESDPKRRK